MRSIKKSIVLPVKTKQSVLFVVKRLNHCHTLRTNYTVLLDMQPKRIYEFEIFVRSFWNLESNVNRAFVTASD